MKLTFLLLLGLVGINSSTYSQWASDQSGNDYGFTCWFNLSNKSDTLNQLINTYILSLNNDAGKYLVGDPYECKLKSACNFKVKMDPRKKTKPKYATVGGIYDDPIIYLGYYGKKKYRKKPFVFDVVIGKVKDSLNFSVLVKTPKRTGMSYVSRPLNCIPVKKEIIKYLNQECGSCSSGRPISKSNLKALMFGFKNHPYNSPFLQKWNTSDNFLSLGEYEFAIDGMQISDSTRQAKKKMLNYFEALFYSNIKDSLKGEIDSLAIKNKGLVPVETYSFSQERTSSLSSYDANFKLNTLCLMGFNFFSGDMLPLGFTKEVKLKDSWDNKKLFLYYVFDLEYKSFFTPTGLDESVLKIDPSHRYLALVKERSGKLCLVEPDDFNSVEGGSPKMVDVTDRIETPSKFYELLKGYF